jgi:hypothetical protein
VHDTKNTILDTRAMNDAHRTQILRVALRDTCASTLQTSPWVTVLLSYHNARLQLDFWEAIRSK